MECSVSRNYAGCRLCFSGEMPLLPIEIFRDRIYIRNGIIALFLDKLKTT